MSSDKPAPAAVTEQDADELAALIDELMSSGTQHVNLDVGETSRVRTLNSTDCGKTGACAVPNLDSIDRGDDK
jgi:hypothetical protein